MQSQALRKQNAKSRSAATHSRNEKRGGISLLAANGPHLTQMKKWREMAASQESQSAQTLRQKIGQNNHKTPIQRKVFLSKDKADAPGKEEIQLNEHQVDAFLQAHGISLQNPAEKSAVLRLASDLVRHVYNDDDPGANQLYTQIQSFSQPVGSVSFNYRYHDNAGTGALKYDPVSAAKIADRGALPEMLLRRAGQRLQLRM